MVNDMGYEEVWKVLSDLITELRGKKVGIPNEIIKDLRSAKTMIKILKADPTHTENLLRTERYLAPTYNQKGKPYVEISGGNPGNNSHHFFN